MKGIIRCEHPMWSFTMQMVCWHYLAHLKRLKKKKKWRQGLLKTQHCCHLKNKRKKKVLIIMFSSPKKRLLELKEKGCTSTPGGKTRSPKLLSYTTLWGTSLGFKRNVTVTARTWTASSFSLGQINAFWNVTQHWKR